MVRRWVLASARGYGTERTNAEGMAVCALKVPRHLGWIFRPQLESDYGIDAHVETVRPSGYGSGRLLAAQVKSGPTGFKEPEDDGWIFRPRDKHVGYWLAHSLPVTFY